MPAGVDDEQLCQRAAVPPEALAEWESLGLVERDPAGLFDDEAVERARLLSFLDACGVDADDLMRLSEAEGDVLSRWAHWFGPARPLGRTLTEAADELDVDLDLLRKVWVAAGLGDQTEVFEDDMDMLRTLVTARELGVADDVLVQLVRVCADALGRVADTEVRLFHFHVHERLRGQGLTGDALEDQAQAIGDALVDSIEPMVLYWHRKGWRRALRDDMLLHAREGIGAEPDGLARLPVAVLFADLASFTPLTEAMGDEVAARILDRFSHIVRQVASDHRGRVLKQIGDEFMVAFPSADAAVRCGLDLMRSIAGESEFPGIRMGAHAGPALYREGDYLGSTVNIAARVAAEADRGQFLTTSAVRHAADVPEARWQSVAGRILRGLSEPVDLFEVSSPDALAERPVDPVCGMHVDPLEAEASARFSGGEFLFCSTSCFQSFADRPERYSPTSTTQDGT
ncbi:MAG: YHS domain-containing protein [Actinobacteria bacterium]|nr:YHS domain-containing protein [Actinomycetota bacterium]